MSVLFPHESIRSEQQKLLDTIENAIQSGSNVIAHAPTGLGKTAASLAPALHAIEGTDKFILYLTSRHTQHTIVLDTVTKINARHDKHFLATSIIGKKWMCSQDGADTMPSQDFFSFCRSLRKENKCSFYTNTRGKSGNVVADLAVSKLTEQAPLTAQKINIVSQQHQLCPYEVGIMIAERAQVVITDYFYLFHPTIRDRFLAKINKKLENAILIIDEGHNLPRRLRDLMTKKISTLTIKGAITEAKKYEMPELVTPLNELMATLERLSGSTEEKLISRDALVQQIERTKPYEEFITELVFAGEFVLTNQKQSRLAWIAAFLEDWRKEDAGYARILTKTDNAVSITFRCLDPGVVSKDVIALAHSTILMSGTLNPPEMYRDLLGFSQADVGSFKSPFAKENRLPLIVPRTTTKFTRRSETEYKKIAAVCSQIANVIPGNVIIFFPSYRLRNLVYEHFVGWYDHSVFLEQPGLPKNEKDKLIQRFAAQKERGAALLAVSTGSFGEGIDLPGVLKGVLIVGLPLDRPDLETQELIKYYDVRLGKGWDYGYIQPAMNKTFQNAGRCIRTETDYGVIAFIDERYAWQRYKKCFPAHWNIRISHEPMHDIADFFEGRNKK